MTTRWEYHTLRLNIDMASDSWLSLSYHQELDGSSEDEITRLGREGWELVSVLPLELPGITSGTRNAIAFFKRPA
jgi:Domain of unknown function (DUF4177)